MNALYHTIVAVFVVSGLLIIANASRSQKKNTIIENSYIYGYPLVLMDVTKQIMTNVAAPTQSHAPINQFALAQQFPDATFTDIVRPNADTLYSMAWLDVTNEPIILHVPDTHGRYYVMEMLDNWTNVFAAPGSRTTGTSEKNFAIVGPNWKGELPKELEIIKAPTNSVWIIGRTQTNGVADYEKVREIQKQYTLTPLRFWQKPYTPPLHSVNPAIDMHRSPAEQVATMNGITFFTRLAELLKQNPPPAADRATVEKFKAIGLIPGKSFTANSEQTTKIMNTPAKAFRRIQKELATLAKPINGWLIITNNIGAYGTNYAARAAIAYAGIGANLPEDAVYPTCKVDNFGNPFSGAHNYVIHFTKEQLPPAQAFWSITLYNEHQYFAANSIDRYTLGDRDSLRYNHDGSLDIYIQHSSPGPDKQSNWLPAPEGTFDLTMRIYWPKQSVINGAWTPPPVTINNAR